MIVELLMSVMFGFFAFIVGLLPSSQPPAWLGDGSGYLATIWGYGDGLGAWIPWALVGTVFSAVMVCVGIGFGIKIVRIVASFATLGGGSAA